MLVKTAFMLKPLEARRKKTFGDLAVGGLVIDSVKISKTQKNISFVSFYLRNLRNTIFDQKSSFFSASELLRGWNRRTDTQHTYIVTYRLNWPRGRFSKKYNLIIKFQKIDNSTDN